MQKTDQLIIFLLTMKNEITRVTNTNSLQVPANKKRGPNSCEATFKKSRINR